MECLHSEVRFRFVILLEESVRAIDTHLADIHGLVRSHHGVLVTYYL
jgi:hypothetical protein